MINNLSSSTQQSINVKGRLISLDKPLVMGVININSNSFYSKSRFETIESIISKVTEMLSEGADIIDIGASSSKPGVDLVGPDEEIEIIKPVLQALLKQFPELIISVDTYNSKTAEIAVQNGAAIINDISGGTIDAEMLKTVSKLGAPYIMMHMQGVPKNMQDNPQYSDVVKNVLDFFIQQLKIARSLGIRDILIDPGFGFGKNLEHNYTLLKDLSLLKMLDCPILVGVSRKSLINKVIHTKAADALNGTSVLNTIALLNGASILRVHDVKEAKQAIELVHFYQAN